MPEFDSHVDPNQEASIHELPPEELREAQPNNEIAQEVESERLTMEEVDLFVERARQLMPVERVAIAGDIFPEARELINRIRENERKANRRADEVQRASMIDTLTKLPNDDAYKAAIERILEEGGNLDNLPHAVFDADGLKTINDAVGHQYGDELLKKIAHTLQVEGAVLGISPRTIFRRGSKADEFVVLGPMKDLAQLVDAVVESFGKQYFQNDQGQSAIGSLTGAVGNNFEEADRKMNELKGPNRRQPRDIEE